MKFWWHLLCCKTFPVQETVRPLCFWRSLLNLFNNTAMFSRHSSRAVCANTCAAVLISLTKTTTKNNRQWTFFLWLKPYSDVIVSQGDVSDFHHIQGVVGDLIAVRIQDVGVFLSPPSWKSPAELPTVFWQTPRSCGNLIAVRIHISEFTRRNRLKIQCLIPFWALPNTVTLESI